MLTEKVGMMSDITEPIMITIGGQTMSATALIERGTKTKNANHARGDTSKRKKRGLKRQDSSVGPKRKGARLRNRNPTGNNVSKSIYRGPMKRKDLLAQTRIRRANAKSEAENNAGVRAEEVSRQRDKNPLQTTRRNGHV